MTRDQELRMQVETALGQIQYMIDLCGLDCEESYQAFVREIKREMQVRLDHHRDDYV